MDFLVYHFPVSGVETWVILPPLVAFVVSFFTSMGGVSGAFLLLPFQVSYLRFTTPSVSATNFVYNIVAIPSGVYRYVKEGRMAWPLTGVVIVGTLAGVFIGYYLRVLYLPEPGPFKAFVGCVLLYIGGRLLYEMTPRGRRGKEEMQALEVTAGAAAGQAPRRAGVKVNYAVGVYRYKVNSYGIGRGVYIRSFRHVVGRDQGTRCSGLLPGSGGRLW